VTPRPIYVGTGECRCGRVDTRLFALPGIVNMLDAVCSTCLREQGYDEPEPRTAEDLTTVDGKLRWKTEAPLVHVGKLDLGHDHSFEAMLDANDELIGWLHTHPDARNPSALCQSFCAVRPMNGIPVHKVVSNDPLTLTPSLQCRTCGAHGHVTNGRWEPV
jgi:hypothetical protein